jgi:hypothetical protein
MFAFFKGKGKAKRGRQMVEGYGQTPLNQANFDFTIDIE